MHSDLLIVQLCDFLDDGDGMHRVHGPSRFLSRLSGVVTIDCHFIHRLAPMLARMADVLVLQFVHNWEIFPLIDLRREEGNITVFEGNDNFFEVQPWNPIAATLREQSVQAEYRAFISRCDAVQTSTNNLAELFRPMAKRIGVFRNELPNVPPLKTPPDRPITIGWGGSPGHFADWYALAPDLGRWLSAHPDVHLAVMCNSVVEGFVNVPRERFHFAPFGSLAKYFEFLNTIDIGLAPLLPTAYNRGRSDVKYLEYAAHGIPGIYANLDPYQESVVDGETGFLYKSHKQLFDALDMLVVDAQLRGRIRKSAYEDVSRNRLLMPHIGKRLEFYQSLLPPKSRGKEIPADVLAFAEVEDRYLRIRAGDVERTFLTAHGEPTAAHSNQAIAKMVRDHPSYHQALILRARQLNDARQLPDAQALAQRARELVPHSAAAVCEMGRSQHLAGNFAQSRQFFEQAIEINPLYYPGWEYFLKSLRIARDPQAGQWASRARQMFPKVFSLALLAIAVHSPDEQLALFSELLDDKAIVPHADDIGGAQTYSMAISEIFNVCTRRDDLRALLARSCQVFPNSARLAELYGNSLYTAGDLKLSAEQYSRAIQIMRSARLHKAEYPREDASVILWQVPIAAVEESKGS